MFFRLHFSIDSECECKEHPYWSGCILRSLCIWSCGLVCENQLWLHCLVLMGTFGVHFISVVSGFMWFFYMQADVEIGYLGCWSLFQLMLWYWCAKSDVCPIFFINQKNESALLSLLLFNQQPIKIPLSIIGFYNLHTGCAVMESTSLEVFILYSTRYYFKKCRAVSNVAVSAIIFMLASIFADSIWMSSNRDNEFCI
jgi:hypothetical protein